MKPFLIILLLLTSELCFGQHDQDTIVFETVCDSVYSKQGYKIIQKYFPKDIDISTDRNCVFQFLRTIGSKQHIIYKDTIYSSTGEIAFVDFNRDGIRDIMIHNISDVRSNWTYYLYLVDTVRDKLKKIKGFEKIKNPNYLPRHDIIDNYVISGQCRTSFYNIIGDTIKDYNIVIYDDHRENGTYESEYKNAIQAILKNEKMSR